MKTKLFVLYSVTRYTPSVVFIRKALNLEIGQHIIYKDREWTVEEIIS